ncbi:hypothetical protein FRC07_013384 [Ceratobasidium sp. 392]|nr:hypothetical protein FRC07_013384 [Ceratobasidium sp. 392]
MYIIVTKPLFALGISYSPKLVKKVLRIPPGHFDNGTEERGEETRRQYRKVAQIEGILCGLTYLHGHDPVIVHGNINPGKIYVTANGTIKIGEFGLAESLAEFSHLVPAVSFNGLVRWTSPERLKREADGYEEPASTQSDHKLSSHDSDRLESSNPVLRKFSGGLFGTGTLSEVEGGRSLNPQGSTGTIRVVKPLHGHERGPGAPQTALGNYDRGSGSERGRGKVFDVGPATIDPRLATHIDDQLVSSFKNLTIQENKLPRRPGFGKMGQEIMHRTNYFPVEYSNATIYDYDILVEPDAGIRSIMRHLLQLFMTSPEFAPYAASASHDNMKRLVSLKEVSVMDAAQEFSIAVTYEDTDGPSKRFKNYRISLKLIAKHETSKMTKYLGGGDGYTSSDLRLMLSALNILFFKYPSQRGVMVGRNKWYFPNHIPAISLGIGLEAYAGSYGSIQPSFRQLMVNVQVITTAFYRPGNLAELLLQIKPQHSNAIPAFVKTICIEMTYTGQKTRGIIKDVKLWTSASKYQFACDQYPGEVMSVDAYFQRRYGITLKSPTLPLVEISSNKAYPTLVPPELCTILPGQPFHGKLIPEQMWATTLDSPMAPDDNARNIIGRGLSSLGFNERNSSLTQLGLKVSSQMATVPGRILSAPIIQYGGSVSPRVSNTSWSLKDSKLAVGARLDNWAVLFIQDGERNDMTAATSGQSVTRFVAMCSKLGIQIGRQASTMLDVRLPHKSTESSLLTRLNAISAIRDALLAVRPKPRIVLVVLSNTDMAIYNGIKHLCDTQLDVLTVCLQASKFKPNQSNYDLNIALELNAKLGGANHIISPQDRAMTWVTAEPTMLVGAKVARPNSWSASGTPSITAIVGSIGSMFSQFPASLRPQGPRDETIKRLKEMMIERLNAFETKNNLLPQRILFFRDGVPEDQRLPVHDDELAKIKEAFSTFLTKGGEPYRPKLTIIFTNNDHSTIFFPTKNEDADGGNCKPGTVVDRGVTLIQDFDFFLQAHRETEGTARPTHYTVAYDDNAFTADQLQGLVHGLSYLVAHETKAVSLPSPAYYAGLACEHGRCYLAQLDAFEGTAPSGSATSTGTAPTQSDKGNRLAQPSTRSESGHAEIPTSYRSVSEADVIKEAYRLWGKGPTGPGVRDTMFYI